MNDTDSPTDRLLHPAHFVRTEVITPLGLSVTEAAKALGITRQAMSNFLNEQTALSTEMAIRLEKAFGISMKKLMRMQNTYDIAQAYKKVGKIKVQPYVHKAKSKSQPGVM